MCDNAVSVTTSMTVRGPGMSWSHNYTSEDIIKVPNCTVSMVYVFGEKTYKQNIYPWKRTAVINGDLSTSTGACGRFRFSYN